MAVVEFPPLDCADENGLLAVGGDLEVSSLKLAYSQGIFPWPVEDYYPIPWFSPDPRGIICFRDLNISKSLQKFLKKSPFVFKFNQNFHQVILNCAQANNRKDQGSTWITKKMIEAYINLHYAGIAYSLEVYLDNELVGGLYGVQIGKYVNGESMFYKVSNASKCALIYLLNFLYPLGIEWIDTQMCTPVITDLGGKEIPRSEF